ncbi:MAG: FIST N-terminal domain-containing protein, partial [Byssovorax sp.]
MILETLTYDLDTKRWSTPVMPPLDGENTLVLAFGSRDVLDDPAPLAALRRAYPKAKLLGCSSAGEIVGTTVRDRTVTVSVTRFDKTRLDAAMVEVK